MTTRYYLWTAGCQMNKADSEKLAAGFGRLGLRAVDRMERADVVVLNTCSVRQHAEDRAYSKLGRVRQLKQEKPALKVVLMGCMVGLKSDDLRKRFPQVDVFARPQQFEPILELVQGPHEDLGGEFWPTTYAIPEGPTAFVPVVHGCNKFCTYCIVPYRRGREKSRPLDEIVREVAYLTAHGVREVTLLGQTVEAYGHDLPEQPDLGDLARALSALDRLQRIRFLTSYPRDMTRRILEAVAGLPKVMECFSMPVQSGSDAVLESMRRGYTRAEYLAKIAELRALMPRAGITTDVIVGYPGESEADFEATCALLEEVRFHKVHVAAYSPRPGTIAWRRLADDVPAPVKAERLHRIEAIEARISQEIHDGYMGSVQEVLVEGVRAEQPFGRTRSGILVHLNEPARIGAMADVHIEHAGPWALRGAARDAIALA
ncbi:MAG: tRNA (N6-isopentenyl adenosine(37)-C2)-methylthiotransferase MiaB [Dehalococcoidia bacterium]|nr:tRNA (N6-isopentenyl adenosine(37)-C2)-methylthiotransferase MiaB [Chloroflexi bacterium CFX7]MCK6563984.1 tRNA (N6-isopentenyl adenosine(37)-C2)-methylthiotransferase MiaB [Dehalococcoidia bacterium]NUQ55868.1 tRNA (N6-isopentenyl adenosine(37)-C2)-methylthiotransferase MiaB [Dehalococcoidia bacterium]